MAETESFIRWLKKNRQWAAFKARRFELRLDGMSYRESWNAAAREYGWSGDWAPLDSDTEKQVDDARDPPTPRALDLPELPDKPHWDDLEGEENDSQEEASATDPEAEAFLRKLSGSSEDLQQSDGEGTAVGQDLVEETFADDLLAQLERALTRQTEFAVDRTLNELRVMFDAEGETLEAFIAYHSEHRVLHARVFFPFIQNAAIDLLRLSGRTEFSSIVGIDSDVDEFRYVVRATISTASGSVSELVNTLQELLGDAIRVSRVLRKHE